jgi:hypothetical protein
MPQKLDKDLGIVANSDNPFDEMIGNLAVENRLEITPGEFVGKETRHPLFALMKCYFKSRGAVCFGTGVKLHQNMGKSYALEKDHIFAYSVLKEHGYDMSDRFKYALAQEITNRAILSSVENRTKSDQYADIYLSTVKERFPNALKLQLIPEDESLWKIENFERFLEKRRAMLAEALNDFIENLTKTEVTVSAVSIEDMIREGENSNVEFKSTLRWDIKESKLNKDLENVILKTVAAFNNGNGGTLFIGVSDEGEVLGLQSDYATLKISADKDGFEQHLLNLINAAYSVQFSASQVKVSFPSINQTEICMVEISKGSKPLYTQAKDKNGQAVEKFYVRSGNASKEIEKPSEIASYCEARFGMKKAV